MQAPTPISNAGDGLAKRNALILAVAMALGGANPAIVVSLGGMVGQMLTPEKQFATLPVSVSHLGLALGTIPAAMMMRRFGRRNGYLLGGGIGVLAGCLAASGIASASFLLFCVGTFLAGCYASFVQSYRFAATDTASEAFRPRAIAWVMTGGIAAGIVGPQTVIWTRDMIDGLPFVGAFIGHAALALLAILVVSFLRAPPVFASTPKAGGRPLWQIMAQPRFVVAVTAGLVSHAMMSFMMTAAPLAMIGCGLSVGDAALGIQWHILAMFTPSFFAGRLINRFGKMPMTAVGLALIALSAVVGLSGLTIWHFWAALVLLGIGWNFGFIGATALVMDCYRPEERSKVQGANDFLIFGSTAIASFSSGGLLNFSGWDLVNWLIFPPVIVALSLLVWQKRWKSAEAR